MLPSFNKQDQQLWNVTTFLAEKGLVLSTDTTTEFDADNDLVLQKAPDFVSVQDLAILRFIKPIKDYQFVEIDVYAINDNKYIEVAAVNDYAHFDPTNGSYARASTPFTIGPVRTFRFPYVGEIEAFVFKGFVSTGSFIVKEIRFFSLPPQLRVIRVSDPDSVDFAFGLRYMDLVGPYNTQTLTYEGLGATRNEDDDRWEFTFIDGPAGSKGTATFDFISADINYGILRITKPENGQKGVGYVEVEDQLNIPFVQASAEKVEYLITRDKTSIDLRAFFSANTLPPNGLTYFFELLLIENFSDTNVWGTRVPRIADGERTLGALRGEKGATGATGPAGDPGASIIGPTGPSGEGGLGTSKSAIFYADGTWSGPEGASDDAGNFIVPDDVYYVEWTAWPGGGGGGGSPIGGTAGAGGGGSGENVTCFPIPVIPGDSMPVVTGAKGIGGTPSAVAGTDGGFSSFAGFKVLGGKGANGVNAGRGGGPLGGTAAGTIGSVGLSESPKHFGGSSGNTENLTGGPAGGLTVGGAPGTGSHAGGGGGASVYGPGGAGGNNGANGVSASPTAYSAGGGGGGANNTSGGNGADGITIISWLG